MINKTISGSLVQLTVPMWYFHYLAQVGELRLPSEIRKELEVFSLKTEAQRHLVKLFLVQQVKDDLFAHFDNICVVPMVLRWAVGATDSMVFTNHI